MPNREMPEAFTMHLRRQVLKRLAVWAGAASLLPAARAAQL